MVLDTIAERRTLLEVAEDHNVQPLSRLRSRRVLELWRSFGSGIVVGPAG